MQWKYMNKQYPNNNINLGLQMQSPKKSSQLKSSQVTFTIQRCLDPQSETEDYNKRKSCHKCRIKQNEIRDCSKVIIITFEDTDQSYCDSCLEQLLLAQQSQMKKLEEKFIYQKQFQASISQQEINCYHVSDDEHTLNLQYQVQALEQKQNEIDYLLGKAKNQCQQLQQKVFILEQKQQKFWVDMNKFQKRALKLQQKGFIAKNQGQIEKKSLENLSRTSIIHTFFKIQIQDNYAQVYGLIIGKKPQQLQVNWQETNAAIGHLLLAFNYLILKYGLMFTKIQNVRLKGNLSEVLLRNTGTYFPVGYGVSIGSTTNSQKTFGLIMECLLSQMADLAQHIQQIQNIEYSQQLQLPYSIEKKEGRILDLFINPSKLEEKTRWTQWTKAMRYFLIDFKHILTISSLSDPLL